jgi:exo-beta-1,3-glucanase (GH17 family)
MSNGSYPMSVCYGPYHQAGLGPGSGGYTQKDIENDMAIIAKYFKKIRTYAVDDANQWNVQIASQYGLQVCLGAKIDPNNPNVVNSQIDTAIQQATNYPGTVVHIIVGNEVDRVSNPATVINALDYAQKNKGGLKIPVTSCFTGTAMKPGAPIDWTNAIQRCEEVVYLTVYPWWAPNTPPPGNIDVNMQWSYDNGIKQVMLPPMQKRVIIAEIGWPSAGNLDKGTTVENEALNYQTTQSWVSGNNTLNVSFETFWFEMFDEPWKTDEGPQGPFWGLYGSGISPAPKFQIPP